MIDWKGLSDEELNAIATAANSEIFLRKEAAKQRAWDDFVRAFRKFAYEFGGISIISHESEDYYFSNMTSKADFDAMCQMPGFINTDLVHCEDEQDI